MKNSLSASERKGIIVIALVALLITGAGIFFSLFRSNDQSEINPGAEAEIIVNSEGSEINENRGKEQKNKNSNRKKKGKKKKGSKKGSGKKNSPKEAKRRSPLDEVVG